MRVICLSAFDNFEFDNWDHHFWYTLTQGFPKIYHTYRVSGIFEKPNLPKNMRVICLSVFEKMWKNFERNPIGFSEKYLFANTICLFVFAVCSLSTTGPWAGGCQQFSLGLIKIDDDDEDFSSNDHSDAVTAFDVFGRIHGVYTAQIRKYRNTKTIDKTQWRPPTILVAVHFWPLVLRWC